MSGVVPIDVSMNSTWYGLAAKVPSVKVVEGKTVPEPKSVEVEAVAPEEPVTEAPPPALPEEISPAPAKEEIDAPPHHSGGGLMAKLGIPVAAAVAVWAVIAKVAA